MAFSLSSLWQRPDCLGASLSSRASPCPPRYLHLLPTAYLQQESRHLLIPVFIGLRLFSRPPNPISYPRELI